MAKIICDCCGNSLEEAELFHNGNYKVCGDCAIKEIVKTHGVTEESAYRTLEKILFS